jgi:hypothetical protein
MWADNCIFRADASSEELGEDEPLNGTLYAMKT